MARVSGEVVNANTLKKVRVKAELQGGLSGGRELVERRASPLTASSHKGEEGR